ncbi:hypothetical protein KIPB_005594 [Kipferlia bialata]|uniref:Uncharacterized protein n=1 Tax=Kipferlia bialata TaxID=797122 RepID=A0A9K3GJ14_9EUKA|nr:hypothetical protein KIPB_005594 [Kipferlia bialata]|eukprot:g5594.t1
MVDVRRASQELKGGRENYTEGLTQYAEKVLSFREQELSYLTPALHRLSVHDPQPEAQPVVVFPTRDTHLTGASVQHTPGPHLGGTAMTPHMSPHPLSVSMSGRPQQRTPYAHTPTASGMYQTDTHRVGAGTGRIPTHRVKQTLSIRAPHTSRTLRTEGQGVRRIRGRGPRNGHYRHLQARRLFATHGVPLLQSPYLLGAMAAASYRTGAAALVGTLGRLQIFKGTQASQRLRTGPWESYRSVTPQMPAKYERVRSTPNTFTPVRASPQQTVMTHMSEETHCSVALTQSMCLTDADLADLVSHLVLDVYTTAMVDTGPAAGLLAALAGLCAGLSHPEGTDAPRTSTTMHSTSVQGDTHTDTVDVKGGWSGIQLIRTPTVARVFGSLAILHGGISYVSTLLTCHAVSQVLFYEADRLRADPLFASVPVSERSVTWLALALLCGIKDSLDTVPPLLVHAAGVVYGHAHGSDPDHAQLLGVSLYTVLTLVRTVLDDRDVCASVLRPLLGRGAEADGTDASDCLQTAVDRGVELCGMAMGRLDTMAQEFLLGVGDDSYATGVDEVTDASGELEQRLVSLDTGCIPQYTVTILSGTERGGGQERPQTEDVVSAASLGAGCPSTAFHFCNEAMSRSPSRDHALSPISSVCSVSVSPCTSPEYTPTGVGTQELFPDAAKGGSGTDANTLVGLEIFRVPQEALDETERVETETRVAATLGDSLLAGLGLYLGWGRVLPLCTPQDIMEDEGGVMGVEDTGVAGWVGAAAEACNPLLTRILSPTPIRHQISSQESIPLPSVASLFDSASTSLEALGLVPQTPFYAIVSDSLVGCCLKTAAVLQERSLIKALQQPDSVAACLASRISPPPLCVYPTDTDTEGQGVLESALSVYVSDSFATGSGEGTFGGYPSDGESLQSLGKLGSLTDPKCHEHRQGRQYVLSVLTTDPVFTPSNLAAAADALTSVSASAYGAGDREREGGAGGHRRGLSGLGYGVGAPSLMQTQQRAGPAFTSAYGAQSMTLLKSLPEIDRVCQLVRSRDLPRLQAMTSAYINRRRTALALALTRVDILRGWVADESASVVRYNRYRGVRDLLLEYTETVSSMGQYPLAMRVHAQSVLDREARRERGGRAITTAATPSVLFTPHGADKTARVKGDGAQGTGCVATMPYADRENVRGHWTEELKPDLGTARNIARSAAFMRYHLLLSGLLPSLPRGINVTPEGFVDINTCLAHVMSRLRHFAIEESRPPILDDLCGETAGFIRLRNAKRSREALSMCREGVRALYAVTLGVVRRILGQGHAEEAEGEGEGLGIEAREAAAAVPVSDDVMGVCLSVLNKLYCDRFQGSVDSLFADCAVARKLLSVATSAETTVDTILAPSDAFLSAQGLSADNAGILERLQSFSSAPSPFEGVQSLLQLRKAVDALLFLSNTSGAEAFKLFLTPYVLQPGRVLDGVYPALCRTVLFCCDRDPKEGRLDVNCPFFRRADRDTSTGILGHLEAVVMDILQGAE